MVGFGPQSGLSRRELTGTGFVLVAGSDLSDAGVQALRVVLGGLDVSAGEVTLEAAERLGAGLAFGELAFR
jgi:hypothetical protein